MDKKTEILGGPLDGMVLETPDWQNGITISPDPVIWEWALSDSGLVVPAVVEKEELTDCRLIRRKISCPHGNDREVFVEERKAGAR